MSPFGRTLLLGAVLVVVSFGIAGAADLGGYGDRGLNDHGYAPQTAAGPSSWYLRLDGGVALHHNPSMAESGAGSLTDTDMDRAWTLGGGLGYYFSKNVRGDLTYDHRFKSDVSGYRYDVAQTLAAPANDCDAAALIQTSCYGTRSFGLTSDVVLANVYYDIDCRCHVTPYLGVGLGIVHHRTAAGVVTNATGVAGDIAGAASTHVAAALMAGFSMQLRERLAFDAGYRFLYLGEAATGAVRDRVGGVAIAPEITIEQIYAHEFRVGLRYDIR
jgi:opacity protein-like surface antigen